MRIRKIDLRACSLGATRHNATTQEMEDIMKKFRSLFMGMSMLALMASPAFAIDTSQTYNSGILVGVFLAFCALIVVMQLMPTLIILYSFIKGLIQGTDKKVARQSSRR